MRSVLILSLCLFNSLSVNFEKPTAEEELESRGRELFQAILDDDLKKCLELSDPASVKKHGQEKSEKFFRTLMRIVNFSRVGAEDYKIVSSKIAASGKTAQLKTQVCIAGLWQSPSTELWVKIDGNWYYQETLEK
ncbi:hypothetical protein [Rubinisphaera italica]|uniref:DUF4440 domain-containing protein n=1 Tax=Rubinisphaera italica TaxID=2527969 RepID=A0A5C5XPB3_9PLAN|nr:hypothetical protein [Rubinisphaera italica]TWT64291.1 hypothetical protein Pan54_50530 [Rubinisphaera italica]